MYDDSIAGNLDGCTRLDYYLAFDDGKLVGITGIYSVNDEEAWLGWYGVVPECRSRGYGNAILDFTLEKMKSYGYKIALLYTEKDVNVEACKLYRKKGFAEGKTYTLLDGKVVGEQRDRSDACHETVFFKSLAGSSIDSWDGTPVF